VSRFIVDYNLTPTKSPGWFDRLLGAKAPRVNTMAGFEGLSKLKFVYGVAKGGVHTFLISYGMVFEVHWAAIGEGLYERSPLYSYRYLDGVFLVPPDAGFSLPRG
jgi:hypothetical protein